MSASSYTDSYICNVFSNNQNLRRSKQLRNLKKRLNQFGDDSSNITNWWSDEVNMQESDSDESDCDSNESDCDTNESHYDSDESRYDSDESHCDSDESHYSSDESDYIPFHRRKQEHLEGVCMFSEWMVNVPKDLEKNWYFKAVPVGKRGLVIAAKGYTKVYNIDDSKIIFKSALPSGGFGDLSKTGVTVLDCAYANKTFYVLDVLVWNGRCLQNSSAEFRFYLLDLKFKNCPELLSDCTKGFKFRNIGHSLATRANMEYMFSDVVYVHNEQVDINGVLFYHKESFYIPGITSLIGWLQPHMLPEQLDIKVHSYYLLEKPERYTTFANYLVFLLRIKGKSLYVSISESAQMMIDDWADVADDERICQLLEENEALILSSGEDEN